MEERIPVEGAELAATLTTPSDGEPAAALVALHGADGGTREHHLLSRLHTLLPPIGVGVLTFDRRGEGASTGAPSRGDFHQQAVDAAEVAEWLRARPEIDAERIGCFAFSQGAWVGPLALDAARFSFFVLVGASGVTPAEQMRYGVAANLRRAGYTEQDVAAAAALQLLVESHAHGEVEREEVDNALQAAAREEWWGSAYLPDRALVEAEQESWCAEMDFDPEASIANTAGVPTLLVYGTDDLWLPVGRSVEVWQRHHPDLDVLTVNGASHDLLGDDAVVAEFEETLTRWLANVTRP